MTSGPGQRRRPRVVGIIVLVLILFVLGGGIASLSLDDGKEEAIEITGAGEVQQLLGGIKQQGSRLGDSDAPVTVDLFNDLQCDPCAEYQLEVVPPLVEEYVRTGKAQLEYRHFPMGQRERVIGDSGALSAAQQDYGWQFIQLFFINQDEAKRVGVSQEFLDAIAGAILEMDGEQWQKDFDAPEVNATLDADGELAVSLRLPADPAVVVTGPTGSKQLDDAPSLGDIEAAIAEVG